MLHDSGRVKKKRRSSDRLPETRRDPLEISLWVVAFLDLLGYSAVLDRFDIFPLPAEPSREEAARKAFAQAVHLRRRMIAGANELTGQMGELPDVARLPPPARALAREWRASKFYRQDGPDHIILGSSLAPTPGHFPIQGLYTVSTPWSRRPPP